MKMYTPSGDEVLVDKAQVPALETAGWTKEAPETTGTEESATAEETKTTPARKKRIIKPKA